MPEVDPVTHQPLSDSPDGADATRGGRLPGDRELLDASPDGGTAKPEDDNDLDTSRLPGEKRPEE
ncbi:MAG: hypothetical protein M3066_14285 [Actinomycetota bacterium]|nr:hypothetical protein [Actinomycetota bacterium]